MLSTTQQRHNAIIARDQLIKIFGEGLDNLYPDVNGPVPTRELEQQTGRALENYDFEDSETSKENKEKQIASKGKDRGPGAEGGHAGFVNLVSQVERLPVRDFVIAAYQRSLSNDWETTGKSTTWEFCRLLKARSDFFELESGELLAEVLAYVDLTEDEQLGLRPSDWRHFTEI